MHQGVAEQFGAPLYGLGELFGGEFGAGAGGSVQDAAVFVGQPGGAAGEVDGGVGQAEGGDEFFGVVADDDFGAVDDGDGGGEDAAGLQVGAGGCVGEQVVVFILNAVGREEFLQGPAAESTGVGVDVDGAGGGGNSGGHSGIPPCFRWAVPGERRVIRRRGTIRICVRRS